MHLSKKLTRVNIILPHTFVTLSKTKLISSLCGKPHYFPSNQEMFRSHSTLFLTDQTHPLVSLRNPHPNPMTFDIISDRFYSPLVSVKRLHTENLIWYEWMNPHNRLELESILMPLIMNTTFINYFKNQHIRQRRPSNLVSQEDSIFTWYKIHNINYEIGYCKFCKPFEYTYIRYLYVFEFGC